MNRRSSIRALGGVLVTMVVLVACGKLTDSADDQPPTRRSAGEIEDSAAGDVASGQPPLPPRPSYVPDGWELWQGFEPKAGIYVPTRADLLPPPAQWKPCPNDFAPFSDTVPLPPWRCDEWATVQPGQKGVGGSFGMMGISPRLIDGRMAVPQIRVFEEGYYTWVTVDLFSGQPLAALLRAPGSEWRPFPAWPSDTGTAFDMTSEIDGRGFRGYLVLPHGVISRPVGGRRVGDPERVRIGSSLMSDNDHGVGAWVGPWTNPRERLLLPNAGGRRGYVVFFRGDSAYTMNLGGAHASLQVARPGKPLETWFDNAGDLTVRDYAFATDDVDVVWNHYEGCVPSGTCERVSLYTSPYPKDGERPRGRRLHSASTDSYNLVVGCGWAASTAPGAGTRPSVHVTRLSDGNKIVIGSKRAEDGYYTSPLAVTCTHVYFLREAPGTGIFNVVRVELSGLPFVAPD